MKRHFASLAFAMLMTPACSSNAGAPPQVDQTIYHPAPPFVPLKRVLYVRERERPLLPRITAASDSIVLFMLDMFDTRKTVAGVRRVMPGSQAVLRLPPQTNSSHGRFAGTLAYCWTSENDNQLAFLIEWADSATKERYTDSYVFVRQGNAWYFEKHGSVAPRHWTQTERYFQRACP